MMFSPQEYTDYSLDDLEYRLGRVERQLRRTSKRRMKTMLEIESEYLRGMIRKMKSGELKERP